MYTFKYTTIANYTVDLWYILLIFVNINIQMLQFLQLSLCCVFQVVKAAKDCALQYMNFMNVIFAAQKHVRFHSHSPCYYLSIVVVFISHSLISSVLECPYRCLCPRLRLRTLTTGKCIVWPFIINQSLALISSS